MRILAALLLLAGDGLTPAEFEKLHRELQLKGGIWEIPWQASVTEARRLAARENKPVFLHVNTGNILGFVWGNGVIARGAVYTDPEIVSLLKTSFVPVAIDNVANPNMTAEEKEFLKSRGGNACTEGMAVFSAGGTVLGNGGGYEPASVKNMLKKALKDYKPEDPTAVAKTLSAPDPAVVRRPPDGGLVLYVAWKVVEDYSPESAGVSGNGKYDKTFKDSIGVDRLWVRKDEAESLAKGAFPDSLKARLARYHLTYVMSGKVKDAQITLQSGQVTGSFQSDTGDSGDVLGHVESRNGTITRFDLVAKGAGEKIDDCGFAACLTLVPKGRKVQVAVGFTLADVKDGMARILPHHSRDGGYLR